MHILMTYKISSLNKRYKALDNSISFPKDKFSFKENNNNFTI